jgi:ABC-2 type transport system ATP-binding protein
MPALIVENLKKSYGKMDAVKGISFTVAEKEIFALIGPNGAGKSTTLKMLATILNPTSGKAEIYGLDLLKQAGEIRKIISYLPEEAGAYKNLSGTDYLEFMAAMYTDDAKKQKEYVNFGSHLTNLQDRLKDKIKTYSKGMTRKLLLARTVMSRPKLAILDEPTSGLDIINGLEIRKTIRELAGQGMAVLLSSHNMLEIEYLSDRVGIIEHGSLKEVGNPQDLKTKYHAANLEEVFVSLSR